MGLLDNIMGNEICLCCKCDAAGNPGCPHQISQLRLPVCDTCPVKSGTTPPEDVPEAA